MSVVRGTDEVASATTPAAQIEDDLPNWRDEFAQWWDKRVRPLVDFRSFLHQRRLILQHPELAYCDHAPEKQWKRPFDFALNAALLTFGVCAIIGVTFHTAFPDPDTKHDWIARAIVARINALDSQRRMLNPADPNYRIVAQLEVSAKEDLREHLGGLSVPHGNLITTIGTPLVVYLIGVLYPALVRHTRARSAPRASAAREIVYYYFSARTFWPIFAFMTTGAVVYFGERYSILNQYSSVSQTYPLTSGLGLVVMNLAGGIIALAFLYSMFATPVVIHKCARKLPELIGVTDASSRRILYWGLHVTVAIAVIAAFTIAILVMGAYSAVDSWTDHLHQYTAAEFLTR